MTEDATQRRWCADLLDRAFGGSRAKLVLQALSATPATAEELRQIRALLDCDARRMTPMTPTVAPCRRLGAPAFPVAGRARRGDLRVAARLLRAAEARYALGVGAMIAMLALPVLDRSALRQERCVRRSAAAVLQRVVDPGGTTSRSDSPDASADRAPVALVSETFAGRARRAAATLRSACADCRQLPLLVAFWLAGVLLLSLGSSMPAARASPHSRRNAPWRRRAPGVLRRVAARLGIGAPWVPLSRRDSRYLPSSDGCGRWSCSRRALSSG